MKITKAGIGDSVFLSCGNEKDLEKILSIARNKIAKLYNKGFSKNSLIQIPEVSTDVKHAYHLYMLNYY